MTGVLASWAALPAAERKARCRCFAGLAHVFGGPAAYPVVLAMRMAEDDPAWFAAAEEALAVLPTIPVRRMWSVMAALEPPAAPKPSVTRVL